MATSTPVFPVSVVAVCRACGSPTCFDEIYCRACQRDIERICRRPALAHPMLTRNVLDESRALTRHFPVSRANLPADAFESLDETLDRHRRNAA
jgi:predicted amidophosphoribosyltransferase